jgi:drug/metabolite transporter (DMT)-like permease
MFFSSITGWLFAPLLALLFGLPPLSALSIIPVILGVSLIYSYGLYGKALESNETSRIVLLFNLTPVVIFVLGFLFLGQKLSGTDLVAFVLILAGAFAVSYQKQSSGGIKLNPGMVWILAAIILWSIMFLVADWTLGQMPFSEFIVFEAVGTALAGLIMICITPQRLQIAEGLRGVTYKKFLWFLGNNSIDLLGQMSMRMALSLASVAALVTVVTQVQSLYAILLGIVLASVYPASFAEDKTPQGLLIKICAGLVMFAGFYVLFLH